RSWSSMALSIAISMVLPIHLYGLAHKISDSPGIEHDNGPMVPMTGDPGDPTLDDRYLAAARSARTSDGMS
ncbi:hypothetical protein, partial [Sphingobium xanthum]|uniref:hypothetical protein n=1 Tax=Sphingobium xanthum TaxID=1387165 RepID=UPI003D24D536